METFRLCLQSRLQVKALEKFDFRCKYRRLINFLVTLYLVKLLRWKKKKKSIWYIFLHQFYTPDLYFFLSSIAEYNLNHLHWCHGDIWGIRNLPITDSDFLKDPGRNESIYSITEWLRLAVTTKITQFQPPCLGQDGHPLEQAAQGPIQYSLNNSTDGKTVDLKIITSRKMRLANWNFSV